jgi:AcrR family transcriptional regulator
MPQVLKDEVRVAIRNAALQSFARDGYLGASMASIAAGAGIGTATIYRYFPTKDELFTAVVPEEIAQRFGALLDVRVRALAQLDDDDRGGEMLAFWIAHRLQTVILLDRAIGTPYARYGEHFVERLLDLTVTQLRARHPGLRLRAPQRFVLRRIFENTRGLLASVLEHHASEAELRQAIGAFWSYQVPGLRGLADHLARGA